MKSKIRADWIATSLWLRTDVEPVVILTKTDLISPDELNQKIAVIGAAIKAKVMGNGPQVKRFLQGIGRLALDAILC